MIPPFQKREGWGIRLVSAVASAVRDAAPPPYQARNEVRLVVAAGPGGEAGLAAAEPANEVPFHVALPPLAEAYFQVSEHSLGAGRFLRGVGSHEKLIPAGRNSVDAERFHFPGEAHSILTAHFLRGATRLPRWADEALHSGAPHCCVLLGTAPCSLGAAH